MNGETILKVVDQEIIEEIKSLPSNFFDFKKYTQDVLTHSIHDYPAMFIYPIPRYFINLVKKYQPNIDSFLDPFAGAGTALVEAIVAGFRTIYGNDLNPLATIIAKAKSTFIEPQILQQYYNLLVNEIDKNYANYYNKFLVIDNKIRQQYDVTSKRGWGDSASTILKDYLKQYELDFEIPNFPNIGYWFLPKVILELQLIKNSLKKIDNEDVYTYFLTIFSETVRYISNRRNNEFKMYRMEVEKLRTYNPNVKQEFLTRLHKSLQCMKDFVEAIPNKDYRCIIFNQDARYLQLEDNSIDLMVTSPPYGDSRTTTAYGEFSRVSLQWLDIGLTDEEIKNIDKNLMGGKIKKEVVDLGSETLKIQLSEIEKIDKKRAEEVYSYYHDLDQALDIITKKMKINSYQIWIVGNRTVKKVNLLTDLILTELGKKYNLRHVITVKRNIPTKRMPKENSPTNKIGERETTMNNEFIVILRKER